MKDDINNGLLFINEYFIPPEILSLILSNVDVKNLYKHCTLVCKLWNDIIKSCVWKLKCDRQLLKTDHSQLFRQKQHPHYVYQALCVFKQSFYTNLIQNACGLDGFNHWIIDKNGGHRFIIEDCILVDTNFREINDETVSKCFVTSYRQCSKLQMIDLCGRGGVTQQFIDEYQPPIYVSEWYGSRRDCGCMYQLRVILFDKDYQPFRRCNCNYSFSYRVPGWEGGFYQKVEYVFKNYGPNVRYIFFHYIGKDTQFWAGHYGSKFTNANVQLLLPGDTSKDHLIDLHSQQSYHEQCGCGCNDSDCRQQKNDCQSLMYMFDKTLIAAVQKYKDEYFK
ncbi:F-box only protein 6-like isoform X1 [Chrysoperla carnea]|uniref:F-box only protein 6-like isoform X1 n=1 Tax=Chrysoperla carnea TaxID=189513 RepID=UPI001D07E8B3|nr:F-box only protein 6-like isoform X1 [Chrysoperla carnea]